MSLVYPAECRLKKRYDFQRVSREGQKIFSRSFCLHYAKGKSSETRLGITVTKKFGKAHDRNFFKRVIREAFRHVRQNMPKGLDLNVRPLLSYEQIDKKNLESEMKTIFSRL